MQRLTFQVGLYEVNCTVLSINGKALIIDPGAEAEEITARLEKAGLSPAAILLTHAHFDHIGGIPGLLARNPDLPVLVSEADARVIPHPMNQLPPDYPPIELPKTLIHPEETARVETLLAASGFKGLQVIPTPGHTPGGVCYYFADDQLLLSGDTLFAGSVGRTDFPGGDMASLRRSLERLTTLPDETCVIPGHGPFTTIAAEKRGNPFLQ